MTGIGILAKSIGFRSKGNMLWGIYAGYRFGIVLKNNPPQMQISTSDRFPEGVDKGSIASYLDELQARKTIKSYAIFDYGVEIILAPHPLLGYKKRMINVMGGLAEVLLHLHAEPACHNCGSQRTLSFVNFSDRPLMLCSHCQTQIEERLDEQERIHADRPGNRLRGAAGALIGASLGGSIWVVIGLIGYMTAFAGLAIIALGFKGYALMKGKQDRVGVVIVCLICLFAFVLAQFITTDAIIVRQTISEGHAVDLGKVLLHIFDLPFIDPTITRMFFADAGIGFLFLVLGGVWIIHDENKKAANPAGVITRMPD